MTRDLHFLVEEQRVRELLLSDPTFNLRPEHCANVIDVFRTIRDKQIRRKEPPVEWSCTMRATHAEEQTPVPVTFFKDMEAAGCKAVFIGIESGHDGLLSQFSKGITRRLVEETLSNAEAAEIPEVHGFLMLGFPPAARIDPAPQRSRRYTRGETRETLQATVDLVEKHSFYPRVRYTFPLPGTAFYRDHERLSRAQNPDLFGEKLLDRLSEWENTPDATPFPFCYAEEDRLPLADAMRAISWRSLELPNDDLSLFFCNQPAIERSFRRWLTYSDPGIKPLFFPNSETQEAIGCAVVSKLEKVLAQHARLPGAKLGRVLIHGMLPHLVWSSSEAYRPVSMFFGDLCKACRPSDTILADGSEGTCIYRKLDDGAPSPLSVIPPYWRRKIWREGYSGPGPHFNLIPPCWSEAFLSDPNSHPPSECPLLRKSLDCAAREPEGSWSASEVLILSRMRLRDWALQKREILQTPSARAHTDDRILKLYRPQLFDPIREGRGAASDNVSVAYAARLAAAAMDETSKKMANVAQQLKEASQTEGRLDEKKRLQAEMSSLQTLQAVSADSLRQYIQTFESEAWSRSRVADDTNTRDPLQAHASRGSVDRTTPEEVAAAIKNGLWSSKHFLSSDCSVFLDPSSRPVFQGGLLVTDVASEIFIYFEITNESDFTDVQWDKSILKQHPSATIPMLEGTDADSPDGLVAYCHQAVHPWVSLLHRADERWHNHQTIEAVFPRSMRTSLLKHSTPSKSERIGAVDRESESVVSRSASAETLYSRRVTEEEDEPVRLALALMGDMWRYCFQGAVNPHYGEFERFQQLLTAIPNYRDHLTHSLQVFLLGNRILDRIVDISGQSNILALEKRYDNSLGLVSVLGPSSEFALFKFQWTLASLMHDFALPASKANEVINHLFQTFLGSSPQGNHGTTGLRDVLAGDAKKHRAFLYTLLSKTRLGRHKLVNHPDELLPMVSELTYQSLSEDHGFLSAIYLFNQVFVCEGDWWKPRPSVVDLMLRIVEDDRAREVGQDKVVEGLLLEVLDAIVKHNAFSKECTLAFEDAPSYKAPLAFFAARSSIFGSALPGLLLLCDTLSDWGRVIHPDELRKKYYGVSDAGVETYVDRPECQVTGVHATCDSLPVAANGEERAKGGKWVTIKAEYRWRIPCTFTANGKQWCLRSIHERLSQELAPYAPPFSLNKECAECSRCSRETCRKLAFLHRFWKELLAVGSPDRSRLQFPQFSEEHGENPFNRIQLDIKFYGTSIYQGPIGPGG